MKKLLLKAHVRCCAADTVGTRTVGVCASSTGTAASVTYRSIVASRRIAAETASA